MMPLEDTLENIEWCLEQALCAGDQEAIYCLRKQREHTLKSIAQTRTQTR